MLNIGDKVLVKRGVFLNHEGIIEHKFNYNNMERYTVGIFKGKNITEKYIATGVETDFEKIK